MQAKGSKGGSALSQKTAAGAGTLRGTKGQEVEAGGSLVWTTSRWAAIFTGRGDVERVKNKRS